MNVSTSASLNQCFGLKSVIAICISSMLGSGIFVLPYFVAQQTGQSAWWAYLLAALCILPAAGSKMELATAMPTSGGTYVYLDRTFGPFWGTIAGLGLWMSMILKSSFAIMGFGAYLSLIANIDIIYVSYLSLLIITILNIRGTSKTSLALNVITSISVISLLGLIFYGFKSVSEAPTTALPLLTNGLGGLLESSALVVISYAGITKVAALADEVKQPEKNLPMGVFISLTIVTFLYCTLTFLITRWIPLDTFQNSFTPIYDLSLQVAPHFLGSLQSQWTAYAFAGLAILTMISMANAGLLAASRFPYAMARDSLLPKIFSKIHHKTLTPVMSIVASAFTMGVCISILDMDKVVKIASSFIISIYMTECFAVIILREGRVQWYKPSYKTPLYPLVPVLGFFSGASLLMHMKEIVLTSLFFLSIPGAIIYIFYSRNRTERKGVVGFRGFRRKDLRQLPVDDIEKPLSPSSQRFQNDVLVALSGSETSPEVLAEVGSSLVENSKTHVVLSTELPEHLSPQSITFAPSKVRSLDRRLRALAEHHNKQVKFSSIYTHDINKYLFNLTQNEDSRWLIQEWQEKSSEVFTLYNPIQFSLKKHLHCHYSTFKDSGIRYFKNILVFDYGAHRHLLFHLAQNFANNYKAILTGSTLIPANVNKSCVEEHKSAFLEDIKSFNITESRFFDEDDYQQKIIECSDQFDLMITTAKKESPLKVLMGKGQHQMIAESACSILIIHPKNPAL